MKGEEQREELQAAIKELEGCADIWQMECMLPSVMSSTWDLKYTLGGVDLASVEEEKDVGVMIHHTLRPLLQCTKANARAN